MDCNLVSSKPWSSTSRLRPLVSGWKTAQTRTVSNAHVPNMKYESDVERVRNNGVENAMIQLTAQLKHCARLEAGARVRLGCISLEMTRMTTAQLDMNAAIKR